MERPRRARLPQDLEDSKNDVVKNGIELQGDQDADRPDLSTNNSGSLLLNLRQPSYQTPSSTTPVAASFGNCACFVDSI